MKLTYAVFAGGKGTRMGELTKTRNKCMLDYKGTPVISYVVDTLAKVGADKVYVTVNHGGSELIQYLTSNYSNLDFGFLQDPLQGTGKSMNLFRKIDSDYFLVAMGDMVFDVDTIGELVKQFKNKPANYILSKEVPNPEKYGVLEIDGDRITGIIEKPESPPSNLVNLGLYIFHKSIFDFTNNLSLSKRGEYEITDAIQDSINAGNEFRHFVHNQRILDVTSPEDLTQKLTVKDNLGNLK